MAEVNPPYVLQSAGISHPAKLFRRVLEGLFTEGVLGLASADLLVKPASPASMNVVVERGGALVQGDDSTDQGMYFVYNDADVTLAVATAHATQGRKDIVVAHVKDETEGQPDDEWVLEYIVGTPSGSPVEPSLPNTALKLATITVAAAATTIASGAIVTYRTMAAPIGSITSSVSIRDESVVKGTASILNFIGSGVTAVVSGGIASITIPGASGGSAVFSGAAAQKDSSQSIANATSEAVNFAGADEYDTDSYHNPSSNSARFTIPSTGKYRVVYEVEFEENNTGRRALSVRINGSTDEVAQTNDMAVTGATHKMQIFYEGVFSAGDYVQCFAFQASGGAINVLGVGHTWGRIAKMGT